MDVKNSFKIFFISTRGNSIVVTMFLLFIAVVAVAGVSFPWIISMTQSQSMIAQTQVRIEMVQWDIENNIVIVSVRNTGSVSSTIDSISIRQNVQDSTFIVDKNDLPKTIDVSDKKNIIWNAGVLDYQTSYVIRITTSTGFHYETVEVTPSN